MFDNRSRVRIDLTRYFQVSQPVISPGQILIPLYGQRLPAETIRMPVSGGGCVLDIECAPGHCDLVTGLCVGGARR